MIVSNPSEESLQQLPIPSSFMSLGKHRIKAIIEKTQSGFSVYAKDYPVWCTGTTITELHENIVEAVNSYFKDNDLLAEIKEISLSIDLGQFFQHYRAINAKYLAERIGMNPVLLSQYVQGKKRPSPAQVDKILAGLHTIGRELSDITLL